MVKMSSGVQNAETTIWKFSDCIKFEAKHQEKYLNNFQNSWNNFQNNLNNVKTI